jgi:hypothetical protein
VVAPGVPRFKRLFVNLDHDRSSVITRDGGILFHVIGRREFAFQHVADTR